MKYRDHIKRARFSGELYTQRRTQKRSILSELKRIDNKERAEDMQREIDRRNSYAR